ncbi:MAG TPA: MFS transporter [Chthoniobacterales bacterium]
MPVSQRLLTYLCYGAMMSLAIGLNLLPVFLTSLQTSFGDPQGLTQEELGRIGAIGFAGVCLGIAITGPLADRWGAKIFAQLGLVLKAVSLIGMAVSPSYNWLCAAVFSLGLGAGILDMILSPIVAALNPERRSAAMNWLHSFYCIGAVVTILAGTLALKAGLGWRLASVLLVPLPVLLIAFFAPLKFPPMVPEERRLPVGTLIRSAWFIWAMVAIFLGGATELAMAQWLPAYAEITLKFDAWVGGMALLLFSLGMALGRMAAGSLAHRIDSFHMMAWGCGLSVFLFIGGSFFPDNVVALSACILVGFTGSCLWPTLLAVTADRYPEGGASMYAALAALGNAGGIFMPWAAGFIADRSNLRWGLCISALAPLLMLPVVMFLKASNSRAGTALSASAIMEP